MHVEQEFESVGSAQQPIYLALWGGTWNMQLFARCLV